MNKKWSKTKRRKECLCHFGNDDIVVEHMRFNPVNSLPAGPWAPDQEISFYMDSGDDIYFLIVRNNEKYAITLFHDREIQDIVIEMPMYENLIQNLQRVVKALHSVSYGQEIAFGTQKKFFINSI